MKFFYIKGYNIANTSPPRPIPLSSLSATHYPKMLVGETYSFC